MKILVTGHTGFLGTELVKILIAKGHSNLIFFDRKNGDIADASSFSQFEDEAIDHVFHLAAQTFVPKSWDEPHEFIKVNVLGTTNVLDLCRKKNASLSFVSSYLYGRPESLPIKENDKLNPNNPYMLSKYMGEELCEFYANNFQLRICSFRPFNIFGYGQDERFLIPSMIKQATHTDYNEIEVNTFHPKRDYIYIKDVVRALVKSLDYQTKNTENYFEAFNLASGKSYSVKEVGELIKKVFKSDRPLKSRNLERKNEVMDTIADISKMNEILEWKPSFSLEDGLVDIAEHKELTS